MDLVEELFTSATSLVETAYCDQSFGINAFIGRVPTEAQVEIFLGQCGLYDNTRRRWIHMPWAPVQDTEVRYPVFNILQAILKHFGYTKTRDVFAPIDSKSLLLNYSAWLTIPSICALITEAEGAFHSVVDPAHNLSSGDVYPICASPIMVKTYGNANQAKDIVQLGIFAACSCFSMQSNRSAVYSLRITEQDVMLYLFDRSGTTFFSSFNIHENPLDFVRLILGVVSPDDSLIGFDTSVFWKGKQRFIRSLDDDGRYVCYPLISLEPFYKVIMIRSCGTICWKATDPITGMELVIKDTWVSELCMEVNLLKASKGLAGVSQIENSGDDCNRYTGPRFSDLNAGKPITEFESAQEFLCALRDAISGHRNLWKRAILHRDVHPGNIVIGRGKTEGTRGVLIDLSHAKRLNQSKSQSLFVRAAVGSHAFLSVNNLECYETGGASSPHNHLDDLESFFYVFCSIVFRFTGPKTVIRSPALLANWFNLHNSVALNSKKWMYFNDSVDELISPFFGPVFQALFRNLLDFFRSKVRDRRMKTEEGFFRVISQVKADSEEDYQKVLSLFDEAIYELARTPRSSKRLRANNSVEREGSTTKKRR
ncbi:hypothetical protein CPB84DRAFT_1764802 [Gymnopilus junonius]|uniref:Fungal-type protein kinase domain-containing protein n=1 Tax=Gymnopilus junonius TaxID=109634 RepID=A0A9P5NV30_GYMJU|nr:hypothetical protein CPB84DRAFT_1764802 [Gymnopilus junonius]